jgi:hypothetical protein
MKVLRTHALTAIGLCFLGSGCIPVLRTQVVRYGVEGKLVDADSRAPLAKQRIQVTVDWREHDRKTGRQGEFKIGPDRRHYWAWLMGGPFWPAPTRTSIQILSGGYVPYNRDIARGSSDGTPPDRDRLSDGYIDLGIIGLKKSQPGSEEPVSQPCSDSTIGTPPILRIPN